MNKLFERGMIDNAIGRRKLRIKFSKAAQGLTVYSFIIHLKYAAKGQNQTTNSRLILKLLFYDNNYD